MKICICDDETNILDEIKMVLTTIDKESKIETFNNTDELEESLKDKDVDILFMDIQLKETNGIRFIKQNESYLQNTKIIYITGYTEYIEDVFETNPIYFLQKPLSEEKIIKAYKKAFNEINLKNTDIIFKAAKEIFKMRLDDILYIESNGRMIEIHTLDDNKKIYYKLATIEEEYHNFIRIHKSFLVNINKVKVYKYNKVILENGEELPISRSYQRRCKDIIMKFIENDHE